MLQLVSLLFFMALGAAAFALIVAMLTESSDKIACALGLRRPAFVPAPPPMRVRARIVPGTVARSTLRSRRAAA